MDVAQAVGETGGANAQRPVGVVALTDDAATTRYARTNDFIRRHCFVSTHNPLSTSTSICVSLLATLLAAPFVATAQNTVPPADEQIAAAVLPLPADLRGNARVLGYKAPGTALVPLREGANGMVCLALYVTRPDFHVACYHEGLEPF